MVDRRQKDDVVALGAQDRLDDLEVHRRHLRGEDGIAIRLHLLGVVHLLEGSALGLAIDRGPPGEVGLACMLERPVSVVDIDRCDLVDLAFLRLALELGTLLLEGGHEGADTDAGSAEVRDLVDLEDGVDLAGSLEDLLHLVGREGVEAAAEALELDQVEVVALSDEAGRAVEAGVEHPLVDDADRTLGLHLVGDGVLGEDGEAEPVEHLRDSVVDLAVVVVGTACEHDAMGVVVLDPLQGVVACLVHGVLEVEVCLPGIVHGLVDLSAGDVGATDPAMACRSILLALLDDDLVEAALELFLLVIRQEGVEILHLRIGELVDVELQRLRVAHHDRAVVMVRCRLVLLALPADAGHPDEVGILRKEVHDVAMGELGRVAHAL